MRKQKPKKTPREVLAAAFKRGKTNAEALAILKEKHPYSMMSLATVNWTRNRLRGDGLKIPSEHEAKQNRA